MNHSKKKTPHGMCVGIHGKGYACIKTCINDNEYVACMKRNMLVILLEICCLNDEEYVVCMMRCLLFT